MTDKKVILLVEDNPDDEELTRLALQESRLLNELVVARDGEEALEYLFDTKGKGNALLHLVLLDLKLPKVDGLEVLKRLRANERTRFLPVVILTSSKEEKDLLSGYSLGCNSYIQKPVDFAQFVEAIVQLRMYWLVLNVPVQTGI
jgi:two-component system response regulator